MKKLGMSIAFIGLLLVSGCGISASEPNTIKLGGIAALSGVGAPIGQEEERGARLAVNQINAAGGITGKQIEWIPEDVSIDKMNQTISAAQKLLQVDRVVAIIGPTWDEPAAQLLPVIEAANIPLIMPDATDSLEKEKTFEYGFSTWHDNAVGLRELLRYAQRMNIKKIAIIRSTNGGFWQYTADIMHEESSDYGIEIVQDLNIGNPLETDFRTPLTQIKAGDAQALFVVVSDYNQCILLKQMIELDVEMPLLSTESAGNSVAQENCPESMEGRLFFSTPKEAKKYAQFADDFERVYGEKPSFPSSATSYDAVMIFAESYQRFADGKYETLREALADTKNYAGASSDNMTFDEIGFPSTPEDGFVMMTVQDGDFVKIK